MRSFLLIGMLIICLSMKGQVNLVPNYSFENYVSCPTNINQLNLAVPWYDPNNTGANYFNTCATIGSQVSVPHNSAGFQFARTGNAYAGINVYEHPIPNFILREYIQINLSSILIANKKYCMSFYIAVGDTCQYSCNNIGIYFSNTAVTTCVGCLMPFTPQIENTSTVTDTLNWTKISGTYSAIGGEQYITIGNFRNDSNSNVNIVHNADSTIYPSAFIYVDDVSVIEIFNPITGGDVAICKGDSVQLGIGSALEVNYSWSPPTGLNNPFSANPKASPATTTTYTLTQTQCSVVSTASVTVTVNDCDSADVFVPSAFSPNGDGNNDLLLIHGKNIKDIHFTIYDRWGEKVFETQDLNQGWDGTYKGEKMSNAVFVYFLNLTFADGKSITKKGDISLIR